jgi:hypothetical protein
MLSFINTQPARGGILVGLAISIPHLFLPMDLSVAVASLTLVFIAGIYVGFAIINGRDHAFMTEASVAISFAALGLGGIFLTPWIIPAGLIGHALWDLLHHRKSHMLAEIPKWYVPFCSVVDLLLGVILLVSWSGGF